MKVTDDILNRFLEIMDENDEFIFGDRDYVKNQLEACLNTQGYWSGCSIRVYYNKNTNNFSIERRF